MEAKSWIIAVNMGYGHQRTAFPLRDLIPGNKVININDYSGIPEKDKRIWEGSRRFYEFISKLKSIPLLGNFIFFVFNQFQNILNFYPKRDLSRPNFFLKYNFSLIKKGWGKHLINELKTQNSKLKTNLPVISTFFTAAFMAEYFKYPGEIFCVVCDADISRSWAPLKPKESKIKYFSPTKRVFERLKFYGVKEENIFLTGYPLPLENIGETEEMEILKEDLRYRILNLDPQKKYFEKYKILIENNLGKLPENPDHPLTIMFSVGGAGSQKEIGVKILKNLRKKIQKNEIKIILSVGTKEKIKEYFKEIIENLGFKENQNIEIIFDENIESYFRKFNLALRKTDILWTKPSELSFYTALGLPIIIAPPIGSQEDFNMRWLLKSGFGDLQENPIHTDQWLFDWIERGYFAEHAMEGFIEGKKFGTIKIKEIIEKCRG